MLELAYLLVFVLLVALLYVAIRKTIKEGNSSISRRTTLLYFGGLAAWLTYLYFISRNGFIFDKSMPPKFPIFVFIPALTFTLLFLYNKRDGHLFDSIPKSWPIYFQSFRVVMEMIILATYVQGIIPAQATFQGYNFEIIFALTAPLIGYFTFVKPMISQRAVIAWNIIGILFLLVVVSIMVSAYFIPEVWGSTTELIDIRFTQLPLILLPAFMVPAAIFVHIFSIMQLVKSKKAKPA